MYQKDRARASSTWRIKLLVSARLCRRKRRCLRGRKGGSRVKMNKEHSDDGINLKSREHPASVDPPMSFCLQASKSFPDLW